MSKEKIRVLFCNQDGAGVFYWRTLLPVLQLQKDYGDEIYVEINKNVNWDDLDYLKSFNIIHGHRHFMDYSMTEKFTNWCRDNNIITILDIDDDPTLHPTHPMYNVIKMDEMDKKIYNNIKLVDYVTTTTKYFANKLKKYNKNVEVFYNAVNVETAPQFKYDRKESERTRIGYVAGSSHGEDIKLLSDIAELLNNDSRYSDIFQMVLCGFDLRGKATDMSVNPDLIKELQASNTYIPDFGKKVNSSNGDIHKIKEIPVNLRNKYRNNFIIKTERKMKPNEVIWTKFEDVITSNKKIITDDKYLKYLNKYSEEEYDDINNQKYVRRWTSPIKKYAKHYDYIDISLAPLIDTEFNRCKSPLKFVEAFNKKCTLVASDIITYNEVGVHEKNCLLVKSEKKQRGWFKAVKKLVANPNMASDLANQLYEDMYIDYDLKTVTKKRAEWYKLLVDNHNK